MISMRVLAAVFLAAALSACGGDDPDDPAAGCAADPRADTYVAGLEKASAEGTKVRLLEAMPGPPDRGDNTWTFQLADASGAMMDGATLLVRPFMPEHGHGSTPAEFTAEFLGAEGKYRVGPVNFFMPGLWELTVKVTPAGLSEQTVKFAFCVEG